MAEKTSYLPNSFVGDFNFAIDSRGRTNFPADFRHALARGSKNRLVIARGIGPYLLVIPRDSWEKYKARFEGTPYTGEDSRLVLRLLNYSARETVFDEQGRITIPKRLIELAKIEKEVLIIGFTGWAEIWNPDIYLEYMTRRLAEKGETEETLLNKFLSSGALNPGAPSNEGTTPDRGTKA